MMRTRLATILCLVFAWAIAARGQHSDLKEYGLKGKVKSITTKYYRDVMFLDGQWLPFSPEDIRYTTVWHFNEQGFIDTARTIFFEEPDSPLTELLVYDFKNGKKISGKRFDAQGVLTELYEIVWSDRYSYTVITTEPKGTKLSESSSRLGKDFRDNQGEYKDYENGKLVFHEKYSDVFDSNGQLVKAEFTDIIANTNYVLLYKHAGFDPNENPTITTRINITEGTIDKMTVREIEYYE